MKAAYPVIFTLPEMHLWLFNIICISGGIFLFGIITFCNYCIITATPHTYGYRYSLPQLQEPYTQAGFLPAMGNT